MRQYIGFMGIIAIMEMLNAKILRLSIDKRKFML